MLNSTDLLPTLLKVSQINIPANYHDDGEDRSQVLMGNFSARKGDMFWEYGRNDSAFNYTKGRDKSPNLAIRSGRWKLLIDFHKNDPELYDIERDKYENHNVAEGHKEIVEKLKQRLINWRTSMPQLSNSLQL